MPYVALGTTVDGCICSDSQILAAINQNIGTGFDALVNDGPLGSKAFVDGSGTITTGNVSQQIFAANASRSYLFLVNTSDTVMYVNFAIPAIAGQPSITLAANGGFYEPLVAPNQTVNIICATAGKTFVAKQA